MGNKIYNRSDIKSSSYGLDSKHSANIQSSHSRTAQPLQRHFNANATNSAGAAASSSSITPLKGNYGANHAVSGVQLNTQDPAANRLNRQSASAGANESASNAQAQYVKEYAGLQGELQTQVRKAVETLNAGGAGINVENAVNTICPPQSTSDGFHAGAAIATSGFGTLANAAAGMATGANALLNDKRKLKPDQVKMILEQVARQVSGAPATTKSLMPFISPDAQPTRTYSPLAGMSWWQLKNLGETPPQQTRIYQDLGNQRDSARSDASNTTQVIDAYFVTGKIKEKVAAEPNKEELKTFLAKDPDPVIQQIVQSGEEKNRNKQNNPDQAAQANAAKKDAGDVVLAGVVKDTKTPFNEKAKNDLAHLDANVRGVFLLNDQNGQAYKKQLPNPFNFSVPTPPAAGSATQT